MITVALLHFFYMWNETRQAALYLSTRRDLVPISFGISNFQSLAPMQNQLQASALLIMIVPVLVLLFSQRHFMQSRNNGRGEISHAHQTKPNESLSQFGWVGRLLCCFILRWPRPASKLNALIEHCLTAAATAEGGAQDNKHYLQDPFLQAHVAWDSEYYLAIVDGYEAPYIERVGTFVGSTGGPRYWPFVIPGGADGGSATVSLSVMLFFRFIHC